MQCDTFRENLVAYLYGELDKKDVIALHHHLSTCEKCVEEELEFRKTIRKLEKYQFETLPDTFERELNNKLKAMKIPPKSVKHDFRRIAYTVAATVIVTISLEFFAYHFFQSVYRPSGITDLTSAHTLFNPAVHTSSQRTSLKERLIKNIDLPGQKYFENGVMD